jgi:hypothetical protein
MAAECLLAIKICRLRVTRLDALGNPDPDPNNSFITDKPMQLGVTPVILAGEEKDLVGGCDCLIGVYKGFDKLKRFDLELDLGDIEPALLEMLLGATAILDTGDPIGIWWPENVSCSDQAQPNVCVEAWQEAWDFDHQSATWPYMHWIWPSTFWQIAPHTLQNDHLQPKTTGFSRGNSQWGLGPYGDLPEAAKPLGGFFYSTTIPSADCDYQTVVIT